MPCNAGRRAIRPPRDMTFAALQRTPASRRATTHARLRRASARDLAACTSVEVDACVPLSGTCARTTRPRAQRIPLSSRWIASPMPNPSTDASGWYPIVSATSAPARHRAGSRCTVSAPRSVHCRPCTRPSASDARSSHRGPASGRSQRQGVEDSGANGSTSRARRRDLAPAVFRKSPRPRRLEPGAWHDLDTPDVFVRLLGRAASRSESPTLHH